MALPLEKRKEICQWAADAFPSDQPDKTDVAYVGFDVMFIPRGSKHPKEAFEFIAFVNRQEVTERLNSLQCKNSPLVKVSEEFLRNHPNPHIDVYERLLASPNARPTPASPIWLEIRNELIALAQNVSINGADAEKELHAVQKRLQLSQHRFMERQVQRKEKGLLGRAQKQLEQFSMICSSMRR